MPSTGGGTITPIPGGTVSAGVAPASSFSLARYAKLIGYSECAFYGVSHPANDHFACREIWNKDQRDSISMYLAEAQAEIEDVVGYPLTPKWIAQEEHPYKSIVMGNYGKVIASGVLGVTVLASGQPVSHLTDPAVVTVVSTLTDYQNIHVFYPGTELEIIPESITSSAGNLVISIPRCRMVEYSKLETPEYGLDYNDVNNFQATVDVKHYYNDTSVQANLYWNHNCSGSCSAQGCTEYTATACAYVRNSTIGSFEIIRASYLNGAWTSSSLGTCCTGTPLKVKLNYLAGEPTLSLRAEQIIIRLAHSKMPEEPCGCDVIHRLWRRDTHIPELLTRERLECPFGLSDGAWTAWKFANSLTLIRAMVL